MGQKVIKFSDLSGKHIENEEGMARIIVTQHPDLEGGPVEIEALPEEVSGIEAHALDLVTFELRLPDVDKVMHVVMDVEKFNELAEDSPMSEVIKSARRAPQSSVHSQSRRADGREKVNYATLEHAGRPKKGKTSEEEKRIVQNNFDQINERLTSEGFRTIDLKNPDHVARYGLEQLAVERSSTTD
ncbi:hypothetical protein [Streptomyces wuyuanensis]|uniref:hypothetical protein n=1 Tax=Streptomyces wuyuanensis TaxID=1196353 RepID=UPI00344821FF